MNFFSFTLLNYVKIFLPPWFTAKLLGPPRFSLGKKGPHIFCPQTQTSQPDLHLAFCCLLACFVFGLACCSGFFVFVLLFIPEKEADFGGLKSHEISFGDMEF